MVDVELFGYPRLHPFRSRLDVVVASGVAEEFVEEEEVREERGSEMAPACVASETVFV